MNSIDKQVANGTITHCCHKCATKYRSKQPYDGTYTQHLGVCQICKSETTISSASKLFGYHRFI